MKRDRKYLFMGRISDIKLSSPFLRVLQEPEMLKSLDAWSNTGAVGSPRNGLRPTVSTVDLLLSIHNVVA